MNKLSIDTCCETDKRLGRRVLKIIENLGLDRNVRSIRIGENNNTFYQKIISISFKNHDDRAYIILNGYNKKEFDLSNHDKGIEKQILDYKYMFEEI